MLAHRLSMMSFCRSCTSRIPKRDYYIDNHIMLCYLCLFVFYIHSQDFPSVDFLIFGDSFPRVDIPSIV